MKSGNQVFFDNLKQLRNAELVHAGAAFAGLGYQGSVQALWKTDCDHLGGLPVCRDAAAAAAPQASLAASAPAHVASGPRGTSVPPLAPAHRAARDPPAPAA